MIDIFKDYTLQREELLARIAQELQLDKTRLERMETAYKAVFELLKKDEIFFKNLEIELYPQGSVRTGTTVKPINGDDFDLDTVMHIYEIFSKFSPAEIYNALLKVIESDAYYKSICEKKDRCIRLNYKSDFHIDILPACMQLVGDRERIAIPEKRLQSWSSSNPRGFANWFLNIANTAKTSMLRNYSNLLLEAKVEAEPLPDELYLKTPLQRAVQLIKRARDVYYQNRSNPVSSIVLTTLMARLYNSENSIFEAIDNIVLKIKNSYADAVRLNTKFKVLNPVDPNEDFTDSWTNADYLSFNSFITDFYQKWQKLKSSFDTSNKDYIELFGEGIYKKSLTEQLKTFSKSSASASTKAAGILLGNTSFTSPSGQINTNQGVRNEPHHNFGEV